MVTEYPGHATKLAEQAGAQGYQNCIAVGGDGTVHEAVNGLAPLSEGSRPHLGIISSGRGGDFARLLQEQYAPPQGLGWLLSSQTVSIDLGLTRLGEENGKTQQRYFLNIADVGLAGEVVRRTHRSAKRWGTLDYLVATFGAAWDFKPLKVTLWGWEGEDGSRGKDVELMLLVVANGRYFGGGMCIAPDADIRDGSFNLLLAEKLSYTGLLGQLPKLYLKRRFSHPRIHYSTGKKIIVAARQGLLPVDMDGEFLQARRVEFEIIPGALKVLVPGCPSP